MAAPCLVIDGGMGRAQRLRTSGEFAAVYRHGRAYRGELLVVRALRRDGPLSRFGFSAGRAIGNAVARNRLKRRLREAVRSLRVAPGWDIVVNARPGAAEADYHRLRALVGELLARARVLEEPGA